MANQTHDTLTDRLEALRRSHDASMAECRQAQTELQSLAAQLKLLAYCQTAQERETVAAVLTRMTKAESADNDV